MPKLLCALRAVAFAMRPAVALLLLMLLAAVGARADPLRIAVSRGPVSLPIYIAEARGFFEREGLSVQLRDCTSGRQCFGMLGQGEADLATAAELVVTLNRLAGSDAAIIATLSASAQSIRLVARGAGTPGRAMAPDELRGRRIGTVRGTSAEYFLAQWLVFHDIEPTAVTVVPLAPERLTGALAAREIDGVAIWEPLASEAAAALGAEARALPQPRVYVQHFALVASREALDRREPQLVRLLRALDRAERFVAEQPAEARRLLAARLPGPNTDDLAHHDFHLGLDQSLIGTMDGQARWAMRQGLVVGGSGDNQLLRAIDAAPLRKAVPAAVTLVR